MPQLAAMPMEVLDIGWPDLDLERPGQRPASITPGTAAGRAAPTSRSAGSAAPGWCSRRKPIDVGLAAVLTGDKAGMRAVAVSGGKTIGRAQARFAPLGRGPVVAALMNAPLFAQLRYQGPADTLWRLSGVEILDLTGPAAIGADIGGRLVDPVIRGSLRTQNARLESAVTGTVIDQLATEGRFDGPRLVFSRIAGRAGRRRLARRGRARSISAAAGPRSTWRSTRPTRCCSTATTSPRPSPGRSGSARAERGRDDFGQFAPQPRQLHARPGKRGGRRSRGSQSSTAASTRTR